MNGARTLAMMVLTTLALLPVIGNGVRRNPDNKKTAAEIFDKSCSSCHGKDGRAKTFKAKFNHARNLADSEWQGNVSDERIFNSISNGKGKMPAFGKKLSDEQVNSLVTYVRSLKK